MASVQHRKLDRAQAGWQLTTRIAISAILVFLLPGWTEPSDNILRLVQSSTAEQPADGIADRQADREMYVGRAL